ncbi:hypothetical protein P5V15_004176 [Pogonomyrmex californicus]
MMIMMMIMMMMMMMMTMLVKRTRIRELAPVPYPYHKTPWDPPRVCEAKRTAVIEESGAAARERGSEIDDETPEYRIRDNSFRGFSTKVERSAKAITPETSAGEFQRYRRRMRINSRRRLHCARSWSSKRD